MGDKALLILVIIFVLIGVFTYDQYIAEKSGTSPLSQLMETSGMSQRAKNQDLSLSTVSKFATFEEGSKYHLDRLMHKLKLIEQQRVQLEQDRNAILLELVDIKDKSILEAAKFQESIEREKNEFTVYAPEMESISALMMETYNVNNFRVRSKNFEKIEAKLESLRGEHQWGLVTPQINRLKEFIKSTVVQKNLPTVNNCKSPNECLAENVKKSEEYLKEIMIDFEQIHKPRLINAVRINQKARNVFSQQVKLLDLSQDFVAKQNNYYKKKFGELIARLNAITPQDLNNLIQSYQEVDIEHDNMSTRVKNQKETLSERYERDWNQIQELIDNIDPVKKAEYGSYFDSLVENKKLEDQYVAKLIDIDQQIVQILGHRAFENKLFLKNVAALLEVDINRLVADKRYANGLNSQYLKFRADLEERRRTVGIKNVLKQYSQPAPKKKNVKSPEPPKVPVQQQQPVTPPQQNNVKPRTPVQPIKQNINPARSQIKSPQQFQRSNITPPRSNVKTNIARPNLRSQQIKQRNTLNNYNNARIKARDQGF